MEKKLRIKVTKLGTWFRMRRKQVIYKIYVLGEKIMVKSYKIRYIVSNKKEAVDSQNLRLR